jgi:hypothetical protein
MAQSWAATWHPVIGLSFCVKFGYVVGGRTRDLFSGVWTGRAGLTARSSIGACNINVIK